MCKSLANAHDVMHNIAMDTNQLREAVKGLNNSEVARISGVHRNTVSKFAAGGDINLSTFEAIRDAVLKMQSRPVTESGGAA